MIREAKIITRPSLPAPVPGKPNLSHLLITVSRTQCDLCGARGQGYSQSVDLIKYSRDRWNREGEQRVTLDPHEELPEQKGKMEVEGVQGCKASSQVGRKDWDQAKVKAGGGRKQGRKRRLRKTQWAGMTH